MSSVLKWASKKGKQEEAKKQWLHAPEALTEGSVVYTVKLQGVTEVSQAKGIEVIKEAIKKVQFANHIKKSEAGTKASKLRKVDLKICMNSVQIDDAKTKETLHSYPLHHISYCGDDKRNKKVFAFIAKDKDSTQHSCYVFEGEKLAEELTLTVGQAFDLAYRRYLERKGEEKTNVTNKHITSMEQQIKDAEAEKEALKQKIAALEQSQQDATSTQAQNGHQSTGQNDLSLLGDFPSIPGITPPPKVTRPLRKPSQESFDPFDQSFPASNEPQANSSDPMSSLFDSQPSYTDSQPSNSVSPPIEQATDAVNVFPSPFNLSPTSPFSESLNPLDSISSKNPVEPSLFDNNNVLSQAEVPRPNGSSAVSRPAPMKNMVPNLPPPPSKQSVKAAKMAAASGGGTPSPTTPQPNTDLFSLEPTSQPHTNPFSKEPSFDPFADNVFGPVSTNTSSAATFDRQMQGLNLQDGYSAGLVMDDLFAS